LEKFFKTGSKAGIPDAAEKLVPEIGRGFSPGVNSTK
jgi:hypothetical protein